MGVLSKIKKAVTKVATAVTKPVKQATKAITNVVKSVSKPVVKAVSSIATGVKKVATNAVRGVAKAPARVLGAVTSGIKKAATSTLKSVGKVAAKVAVTAAKVSSKLGVAGHIIDVGLAAYTGGAYAAVKLAAKKVITTYAASVVAKKLAKTSQLAASVASALISGGSTKSLALKQAALSATQRYAINKAGQQLAKKSNTLASALNIYNGVSSVAALGRQVSSVSSGARQLGKYMAPASRALPAPNPKPTAQTFPLAAKGGATNIRALPSAAGSYTIKKGYSLWTISSRTGVPVADLMKANGISNPNLIRAGAKLSLPVAQSSASSRGLPTQNAGNVIAWNSGNSSSSQVGSAGNPTKTAAVGLSNWALSPSQGEKDRSSYAAYINPKNLPKMVQWADRIKATENALLSRKVRGGLEWNNSYEQKQLQKERNAWNNEVSLLIGAQNGHITREEADAWYRQAEGRKLGADIGRIDLSGGIVSNFKREKGLPVQARIDLLHPSNGLGLFKTSRDATTYGSFTIFPMTDGTVTGGFDKYDFDIKGIDGVEKAATPYDKLRSIGRDIATVAGGIRAGGGTPFDIVFYGRNTLSGTSATPTTSSVHNLSSPTKGALSPTAR